MRRPRILIAICLLVAGGLFFVTASWPGSGLASVKVAGDRYSVAVLPADPVEVRVTSGRAEAVTLAAVMPSMGHARPPVGTVQTDVGRFVAEEDMFAMDGVWEVSITLSGAEGREVITFSTVVSR
ncbi:hypothetical protein [Micromonospora deserti]|uniref:YtkA-like domain-containing protein n=1 Tax=Micromonospora deserti TaxID=2070366 RepID=A0A2W2DAY2_9ACTN|nr:hypothetical protein [Micromonospora deserti]PZF97939.1 hypothetical protein C1I99_14530 [Micromonospora deserti]